MCRNVLFIPFILFSLSCAHNYLNTKLNPEGLEAEAGAAEGGGVVQEAEEGEHAERQAAPGGGEVGRQEGQNRAERQEEQSREGGRLGQDLHRVYGRHCGS